MRSDTKLEKQGTRLSCQLVLWHSCIS